MTTYKELAYLESTGTQYIDTGIIPNQDTKVKVSFHTNGYPSDGTGAYSLFGSRKTATTNMYNFMIYLTADPHYARYDYGSNQVTSSDKFTKGNYVFTKDGAKNYINETETSSNISQTFTGTHSLYLFALNTSGTAGNFFVGSVSYCQIYDNDVLVRDFIPVLDFNNIPAMYDKVNDVLYYNQGTGQFNYGVKETEPSIQLRRKFNMLLASHKEQGYTPLKYLEGTGTGTYTSGQYIDTGLDYFADFEITAKQRESAGMKALATTTYYCIERENATTNAWRFRNGQNGPYFTTNLLVTDLHTLKWKDGKVYGDGVELGSFAKTSNTGRMYLFGATTPTDLTRINRYPIQISSCRMWNPTTGELVRDYIPVLDKNGTPCMLDRVENKLYYNQGDGDFLYEEWDYTPVDYLESTGTQYIDLNYIPKMNTGVKGRVEFTDITPTDQYLIGSRDGTGNTRLWFGCAGPSGDITRRFIRGNVGTYEPSEIPVIANKVSDFSFNYNGDRKTHWDGQVYTQTNAITFTPTRSWYLFAPNNQGEATATLRTYTKLHFLQIYEGTELVRDLIPVLDFNNTPCMYDKCLNMLFYNAGTGNFEAHFIENGVDYKVVKNIIAEQVDTSTNTKACPYISTGIYPSTNKKTRMRAKAQMAVATTSYEHYLGGTNAGSRFVLGQAGGSSGLKFYFGLGARNYWTTKNVDTDTHIFGLDWATETCSIDDTTWQIPSAGTSEASKPFFINARNTATTANANRPGGGTSYWWKFWEGKKLVYNGIPAVRTSDNKVGLFETVNRAFQTTAGTVEYTYTE